ncbi:hypothetical protein RclHR1_15920009 [Rhizophagus clarus]|nr:hypothetical protein RclHR1_15920009 [Rhizophagus clarus]
MVIPSISPSDLLPVNNFIQNNLINRITINIDNTQSGNTLHHGKRILGIGNKLIKPLPVMTNRRETGSMQSLFKKAYGTVTYEIGNERKDNLPLLIIVEWRVPLFGENKWLAFVGCETDPNFPNERSINEYLKENGNTGPNTLDFEEYSMTIVGSISDG